MSGTGNFYLVISGENPQTIKNLIDFSRNASLFNIVGSCSFSVIDTWGKTTPFLENTNIYVYYSPPKSNGKFFYISRSLVSKITRKRSNGRLIDVELRDDTSMLVDCSWINNGVYNGSFTKTLIPKLLNTIVQRYILSTVDVPDSLSKTTVDLFVENGTTPFNIIKKISDNNGFFIFPEYRTYTEKKNNKEVTKTKSEIRVISSTLEIESSIAEIKYGVNISSYTQNIDSSKVFSEYNAIGQGSIASGENVSTSTALTSKIIIDDSFYRPFLISSSDGVNKESLDKLVKKKRYSDDINHESLDVDIVFENLTSISGELLNIGQSILVRIDEIELIGNFVIVDIKYGLTSATLKLISISTFGALLSFK